jgi:CHAT domain-containing protein
MVRRALHHQGPNGSLLPPTTHPLMLFGAKHAENELCNGSSSYDLIFLDAQVPEDGSTTGAVSVQHALDFLDRLRSHDVRTQPGNKPVPVLVLVPVRSLRVDEACTVESCALAVPLEWLTRGQTSGINVPLMYDLISILLQSSLNIAPLANSATIDLELCQPKLRYWVRLNGEARRQLWAEEQLPSRHAQQLKKFGNWLTSSEVASTTITTLPQQWRREWERVGSDLFRFFFRGLSRELLEHLSVAVGGLTNINFRFIVEDDALHPLPFEAIYEDQYGWDFISVRAPVTRRVRVAQTRTPGRKAGETTSYRILFIGAQLSASAARFEVDQPHGTTVANYLEFSPLANIAIEYRSIRRISGKAVPPPELRLIKPRNIGSSGFRVRLRQILEQSSFDIVHFAGHSHTETDGRTYLILPGSTRGRAEALPIEQFADWVGKAGASLVYLSSCHGSSRVTNLSLVQCGIEHCLGFRWDVEDEKAASFAKYFYEALLAKGLPYCVAFRDAIRELHSSERNSPIWAAPILVTQPDDWAEHGPTRRVS